MNSKHVRTAGLFLVGALAVLTAGCGSDEKTSSSTAASATTVAAGAATTAAATDATDATTADSGTETTAATGEAGEGIVLAVNPWTGSAVNANVAKVVLESKLNTAVTLQDIDENATWLGMDAGDIDAVLEVWPSGHAADVATYIEEKKSVVDIGLLGPDAKIGWYIPTAMLADHPDLATVGGLQGSRGCQTVRHR